jgi:hypothetical protein
MFSGTLKFKALMMIKPKKVAVLIDWNLEYEHGQEKMRMNAEQFTFSKLKPILASI